MDFTTKVEIDSNGISIDHKSRLLMLGSCFTDNIGNRMAGAGFEVTVNPWGVLYNPDSIITALESTVTPNPEFTEWTQKQPDTTPRLQDFAIIILTLGTSWIYRLKSTGHTVANCKKQPESLFTRMQMPIDEIVAKYSHFIEEIAIPNRQKLIFTVSPIRHRRDGMHANQLSKATLLLAIDSLQARYPDHVAYFPAYEIMMDELRDYRFYADDMLHPSTLAVEYIWQMFSTTYCNKATIQLINQFEKLNRTLAHRPLDAANPEYQALKSTTEQQIKQLKYAIQN